MQLFWLIADYHDLRTRFVLRYRSTNGWVAPLRYLRTGFDTSGQTAAERHEHANPRWATIF